MKSKCGKKKRTSKQSGKSKEKAKWTKSNVDLHILWTPPEQPLGELIAGRCYVLKKLAKHGVWLCWDIQQKRDVTVKTVSEEGSNVDAKEGVFQVEEKPKERVVPSPSVVPSEAVEGKHMEDEGSSLPAQVKDTSMRDVTAKTVSEEGSEENAKEGVLQGEEEPKEHVVLSPKPEALEENTMEDEGSSFLAQVKDSLGKCVGITSKRDVAVKTVSEEGTEEDAKESVLQGEEEPKEHVVPSPSAAVEEKHLEDEGSSFLAQVKDTLDRTRCTLSSDIEAHEEAKYCAIELGDMLNDRYYVLAKLWVSAHCTVWLSWDLQGKQEVVLKISSGNIYETLCFRHELDMLHMVHSMNAQDSRKLRIIKALEDFELVRSKGRHFCIVLEAMYCDLSHLLETKGRLPLGLVKAFAIQFLEGLEYLHSCCIIHTDIKPANVVLSWDKDVQSLRVKLIDFGNACCLSDNLCDEIQTKPYRALEVLLGTDYDTSADIWSTACLLFQLATGDLLFRGVDGTDYTWYEDHLAAIIELLGPIPMNVLSRSKLAEEIFDQNGYLRNVTDLNAWSLQDLLMEKYEFPPNDAKALTEFLQPMLEFEPTKRATATQCLQHPWLGEHKGKTNANELKEDVRGGGEGGGEGGTEGGRVGGGGGEQLMEN